MPRTRKGAGKGRPSQDVKSVNQDVRALQKQARELLRKSGLNLREFRKDVNALKKAGVVSSRYDVKEHRPTKYMVRKLKRFSDVLRGEVVPVPAPKEVRQRYRDTGTFEERGRFLMVPKESASQTTQISRGLVEVVHQLRMGEQHRIILPFKASNMEAIAYRLKEDPTLGGLKRPNELFGFRLFGHNMNTIGFPDAESLADYILQRYGHLFRGNSGREGVKHFELFRFRSKRSQLPAAPEGEKIYAPRGKKRPPRERDFLREKRLQRDAARKKRARKQETQAQHDRRLQYQREYKAGLRGPKSEE